MSPESVNGSSTPDIAQAIVETLAYSDVFDYPLTVTQIRRYLVRVQATEAQVEAALACDPWLSARVERHGDYFCLAGRSATVPLRRQRAEHASELWRATAVLTLLIACLPFVRMVAIIGSLTMANVRSRHDDIDVLVVTVPGRIWLTRAFVIVLVRLASLVRVDLCPNYILSTQRLAMTPDDLFTARELAQMLPCYGGQVYGDLLAANGWLARYLPNATPQMETLRSLGPVARAVQRLAEWGLRGALGDRLEQRIQAHKLPALQAAARARGSHEVVLEPEVCKGHMDSHSSRISVEYALRRDHFLAFRPEDAACEVDLASDPELLA